VTTDPISQVRDVYDGVARLVYESFMGRAVHVGGAASSIELAEAAGITAGQRGVELCCGSGATMRLLVGLFDVASMTGVELSPAQVRSGIERTQTDRITFVVGDATHTDLPEGEADFVIGEDAWCYVPDKPALLAEAVRLIRSGGIIAFTDWVEGPTGLSDDEAAYVREIMTFTNLETIDGYAASLRSLGLEVARAEDTGRFGPSFELYAKMIREQLAFDVLELVGFDRAVLDLVTAGLDGLSRLGYESKLIQARFVARKP